MRVFFDAMADGHFVPQGDGTVRFTMPSPNDGYLVLSDAESQGAKIFWRTLVRFYAYACHACALIGFFIPWLGALLLAVTWLMSLFFHQEIRNRYDVRDEISASERDWRYFLVAQVVSHSTASWLRRLAVFVSCSFPVSMVLVVYVDLPIEPFNFMPFWVVSFYWLGLFNKLTSSAKAKAYWARPSEVRT